MKTSTFINTLKGLFCFHLDGGQHKTEGKTRFTLDTANGIFYLSISVDLDEILGISGKTPDEVIKKAVEFLSE